MDFYSIFKEALVIKKKGTNNKNDYGTIGRYTIIKTKHASEERDGTPRDHALTRSRIKEVIREFLDRVPYPKGIYHVFYRKKRVGNYNDLVINVKGNTIVIITIIQKEKQSPLNYFTKKGDKTAVVENINGIEGNVIIIDL